MPHVRAVCVIIESCLTNFLKQGSSMAPGSANLTRIDNNYKEANTKEG
jgi:hypothetical protein